MRDDILSYREMCDAENVQTLQHGMNYRLSNNYSVILMSQRPSAPYNDKIHANGKTIEYEGHDVLKKHYNHNPKLDDQSKLYPSGKLTQNGLFVKAVDNYKLGKGDLELVKVYEKILPGVWSLKGFFELINYKYVFDNKRKVFRFILQLSDKKEASISKNIIPRHNRIIPSYVKKEVWKRDKGKCVICKSNENLHFDHDLPYSKGGSSINVKNVRILCIKHNLQKSAKIE